MKTITVVVNGYKFEAEGSEGTSSLFVRRKEISKVARKLVRTHFPKARVCISSGGSLQITLPYGTDKQVARELRDSLQWLAGESFDGMTDCRDTIAKKDMISGRTVYFGTDFVFVDVDWREPTGKAVA